MHTLQEADAEHTYSTAHEAKGGQDANPYNM